jgi:uncharacterized protein (TIGR00369 family)
VKQLTEMTGLEVLQAMVDGELPPAPIALLLDFRPVELEHGRVRFAGTPDHRHYNPIGTVHGGYAATLLDSAMGCAIHSTLGPGTGYTTLDLQVRYVRPMTADTGEVHAEGTILHGGRRQAVAEGRLVRAADGALLAHGTTTCMILS